MKVAARATMKTCDDLVSPDANNNAGGVGEKCEKYSLRPRTVLKRDEDEEFEAWKPRGKCKKRPKQRPAPLSKYRRKTANARERCRMREINEGFEALRRVLPHLSSEVDSNEKLTKISTLRLAMKYIAALNRILHETADAESDGESFFSDFASTPTDSSDQSLTPLTFSDQSFCTDFSDQLLSPSDFANHTISPPSDLELSSGASTASSCKGSRSSPNTNALPLSLPLSLPLTVPLSASVTLPLANDFAISDFVNAAADSLAATGVCDTLDDCLPEITFEETEYAFDSLNYLANV